MSAGRIRSIKPETLDDEVAVALSDGAWRMWMSLRCVADDFGNCRFGERYLAATVWQDTARDIAKERDELVVAGKAKAYTVADQRYCHLEGWELEQRIDNAGKPRVPGPDDPAATGIQILAPRFAETRGEPPRTSETRGGSRPARARSDPDQRSRSTTPINDPDPEQRTPTSEAKQVEAKVSSEDVDVVWSHYLQIRAIRRPRARINVLSDSDRKLIKKRLAEKLTVDSLCLAVDGLFDSAFHIEKNFLALNYALKESNLEKFITEGERARRGVKLPAANAPPLREADPRQPLVAALAPGSGPEANGVQGDPGEAQLYPEFDWTALSRRKESKPS